MPTTLKRRCRGITPIGDSVPFGREQPHRVADLGADLCGQVLAEHDARQVVFVGRRQAVQRALDHGAAEVGDARFHRRVDALEREKAVAEAR